jgi:hypothetical protein
MESRNQVILNENQSDKRQICSIAILSTTVTT